MCSLQAEGYSTLIAPDGDTALTLAQKHPLVLVLLDFTLPQRDGLEICRMLRMQPETAYVPILMLAMQNDETETIVGLEVGADDYVTVPISVEGPSGADTRPLTPKQIYTTPFSSASQRADRERGTCARGHPGYLL